MDGGLADDELRKALLKYGQNVGPITDTTRELYRKKLGRLLAQKPSPKQSRSISQPIYNTRRSTRSTRYSLPPQNAPVNGSNGQEFSDEEDTTMSEPIKPTRKSVRNSPRKTVLNGSRSRKSLPASLPATPVHSLRSKRLLQQDDTRGSERKGRTNSPQSYSDDSDDNGSHIADLPDIQKPIRNFSPKFSSTPLASQAVSKRVEVRLEHLAKEKELIGKRKRDNEEDEKSANHTLLKSNSFSSCNNTNTLFKRRSYLKQNSENLLYNTAQSNSIVTQVNENVASKPAKKHQSWTNLSTFLPIATALFFIIVGLLYAAMKFDSSPMEPRQLLGGPSQSVNRTHEALLLSSKIYEHVGFHAGSHECSGEPKTELVDIYSLIKNLPVTNGLNNATFLESLRKIIDNPSWGILLLDEDEEPITNEERILDVHYFKSMYPLLTGWCRFKRAFVKVAFRIIVLVAVGVSVWGSIEYGRYRKRLADEEKQEMYTMVQRILDVLQKHHEKYLLDDSLEPFIPIVHVRDMLIQPQDRKKMSTIWTKSKRFLSANESRVRVENQRISGEDFLVWRWIQVGSPARKLGSTAREWQGEAFDQTKSPNTLVNSPTPCLKVRSMFNVDCEKTVGWEMQIQDSILEKCKGNNEILHIFVEKNSKEGLVYIKCMSNEAAGRVFKALHGAWFDARLVTVKFIRLNRFHQRFPATVNAPQIPLKPSSDIPVSVFKASPPESFDKIYPSLS